MSFDFIRRKYNAVRVFGSHLAMTCNISWYICLYVTVMGGLTSVVMFGLFSVCVQFGTLFVCGVFVFTA